MTLTIVRSKREDPPREKGGRSFEDFEALKEILEKNQVARPWLVTISIEEQAYLFRTVKADDLVALDDLTVEYTPWKMQWTIPKCSCSPVRHRAWFAGICPTCGEAL